MFNDFLAGMLWLTVAVGLGPGAAIAVDNFNGRWIGNWSGNGDSGGLQIILSQSGSNLSGEATATGATDCGKPLVFLLNGTTGDGNTATFPNNPYQDPCIPEQGRISLTVTRSGDALSGSYTSQFLDNGVWVSGDSGTVSLNRVCCTITASVGTGGSISPSGTIRFTPGADMTFTATPDAGYVISDLLVDDASKGALASYTFTNIQSNHVISAIFGKSKMTLPFLPLLFDEDQE